MADRDIEQAADLKVALDLAMIKRAIAAAEYAIDHWHELQEHGGPIDVAVRAAAGVIVPATAEQIAAAIEHAKPPEDAWALGHWYLGRDCAVDIARSFAAGLSSGATTGGDDADRGYSAALDAGLLTAEETAEAREAVTRDD